MKTKKRIPPPLLIQIARVRGVRIKDFITALQVSQPTVNKYLKMPKYMNGIHREGVANLLQLRTSTVDDICSGLVNKIGQIEEI